MGHFSWHEPAGCYVGSPVQPGLLERFCGHSLRRHCPSLLVPWTYFMEVHNRVEQHHTPRFSRFFICTLCSCKARVDNWQIWPTNWCWRDIGAGFGIRLPDRLSLENQSLLKHSFDECTIFCTSQSRRKIFFFWYALSGLLTCSLRHLKDCVGEMFFPHGSTWALFGPEVKSHRSMSDRRGGVFVTRANHYWFGLRPVCVLRGKAPGL